METCELLLFFLIIIINLLILNYVLKLEKISCECSNDWKRDYIKYFSYITIVIIFSMIAIPLITTKYKKIIRTFAFRVMANLFSIASIINVYSLFTYSQNMVLSSCNCSKSWERTFIYYYSMVIMSIYIFIISSIIFMSLCMNNKKLKRLL